MQVDADRRLVVVVFLVLVIEFLVVIVILWRKSKTHGDEDRKEMIEFIPSLSSLSLASATAPERVDLYDRFSLVTNLPAVPLVLIETLATAAAFVVTE